MTEAARPMPDNITTARTASTPEGDLIAAELPWDMTPATAGQIMDAGSICIMGRGACLDECPLVNTGRKVFSKIPYGTDLKEVSEELRRRVVFGEAYDKRVTEFDVALAIGSCLKENPRRLR